MRAVVVAGGLGTRLRPYTTILPKALLPIGDVPVIEHILRRLVAGGVDRVEMCVGNLGELIRVYLSEATNLEHSLEIAWHWETEPLGTAGALSAVPDLRGTFLVMNGDILTSLDFQLLLEAHRKAGASLTIATQEKHIQVPYGVVAGDGGRVSGYQEKPSPSYRVSMGVYAFEDAALRYLPPGPCQFPELVQRLLSAGEPIASHPSDAPWFDIGTVLEYDAAVRYQEEHPGAFGVPG